MSNDGVKVFSEHGRNGNSIPNNYVKPENSHITYNYKEAMFYNYQDTPGRAKWAYLAITIGILFSLAVTGLSLYLLTKFKKSTSLIASVVFSLFCLISFIYGYFAIYYFTKKVEKFLADYQNKDPDKLDQSRERVMLNIYLYFMKLSMIIFLIIAVGSIAFQDQMLMEIKSIANSKSEWITTFGNTSYEIIVKGGRQALYAFGAISFCIVILIGIILYEIFRAIGIYRTFQTIMQFISVIFYILGFAFLYLAIYAETYKDVANVKNSIPNWIPDFLFVISILAIVKAILGYVYSYMENLRMLKIFFVIAIIYTLAITVISCAGAFFISKIDQYLGDTKCLYLIDRINQDNLKKFGGCAQKYLFLQEDISKMQCPKERILIAWEVNLGKSLEEQQILYGCADITCCYTSIGTLKSKFGYILIIAFVLVLCGGVLVYGTWYMIGQLNDGLEKGTSDKKSKYLFLIFAIASAAIFIALISVGTNTPEPEPLIMTPVDEAPINNSNANKTEVPNTSLKIVDIIQQDAQTNLLNNGIFNFTLNEDKGSCTTCNFKVKYTYQLTSDDGDFSNITKRDNDTITFTKKDFRIVEFNDYIPGINNFDVNYTFIPICSLIPSFVNLKVTGTTEKLMRYLQDSSGKVMVDVSEFIIGETYDVYQIKRDMSFVTNSTQVIKGRVLFVGNDLVRTACKGCLVKVAIPEFPQCSSQSFYTNADGYFNSDFIYVPKDNVAIYYTVVIEYTNFSTYDKSVVIGGLGWMPDINLGDIELFSTRVVSDVKPKPVEFRIEITNTTKSIVVNDNAEGQNTTPTSTTTNSNTTNTGAKAVTNNGTSTNISTDTNNQTNTNANTNSNTNEKTNTNTNNSPSAQTPDEISSKEITNTLLQNLEIQNNNLITTNVTTITGSSSITIIQTQTIPVVNNTEIEVISESPKSDFKEDYTSNTTDLNITTSTEPENITPAEPIKPSSLVTSIIISSIDNKPLEGVNIYLFEGNKQSVNNLLISNQKSTYASDSSLLTSTKSDAYGNFGFTDLSPNKYTLILEMEGFYTETICIYN